MVHCVQNQFHAGGDAEPLEDTEQIFLDRVFAETQLDGNLAISQTFRYQRDDLFLTGRQQAM